MTRAFAHSIDNAKKVKQSVHQVAKWFPGDGNKNRFKKIDIQQLILRSQKGPAVEGVALKIF